MHCMLDQGDFASGRIYVERGTGSPSWKGDVNLQIYGWGDFAWKRSDGKNVREVRSHLGRYHQGGMPKSVVLRINVEEFSYPLLRMLI